MIFFHYLKRLMLFVFLGLNSMLAVANTLDVGSAYIKPLISNHKAIDDATTTVDLIGHPLQINGSESDNVMIVEGEFMENKKSDLIEALVVGSAESPDPVLVEVIKLEKLGIVKDVRILESFPVQIHLKASAEVIEKLRKIPRKKGGIY